MKNIEEENENILINSRVEDEEDAITQIKQLGTEIFNVQSYNWFEREIQEQLTDLDLQKKINPSKDRDKYSLTERKKNNQVLDEVEEDDWISAFEFETKNTLPPSKEPPLVKSTISVKKSQVNLYPGKKFKKKKKIQLIVEEEKRKEMQSNSMIKKSNKSLSQIYRDKKPLYEKYLQQKVKKQTESKIYKIIKEHEEQSAYTFHPKIKSKYEFPSFMERQAKSKKVAETNQVKIISQSMREMTFQPRINSNNTVTSKVKKIWEKKGKNDADQPLQLKGISQSMIKTGSFFSDQNSIQFQNKNKSFEVAVKSPKELSYILEIQDIIE